MDIKNHICLLIKNRKSLLSKQSLKLFFFFFKEAGQGDTCP